MKNQENMNDLEEQLRTKALSHLISEKPSVIVRVTDGEFQVEVLAKLGRLETKVDMLVGNGQPGRVRIIEEKVAVLERSDVQTQRLRSHGERRNCVCGQRHHRVARPFRTSLSAALACARLTLSFNSRRSRSRR